MPDNIPETGDVVIHSSGSPATPSFAIRAVPDPISSGAQLVRRRNGWRDPAPSALESTCGLLRA